MTDINMKWIPIPTPFPIGPVNVCLIKGDPATLIDCGPYTEEARLALIHGLAMEGVKVSDIQRVIITHFHTDHSGLCRWIKSESGAKVFAHPAEHHYLRDEPAKVQNLWADRVQAFFRKSGVPAQLSDPIVLWFRERGPALGGIGDLAPVGDGDQLPFDGHHLIVSHTPGHSPGSIVLYSATGKYLISGDTLLPKVTPNPLVELDDEGRRRYSSLSAYLTSLDLLEALPWEEAHPGHGQPFRRRAAFIGELREGIEQRSQTVKALLRNTPQSVYDITTAMFGDLGLRDLFLGVSESASHLDLLVERGLARRREEGAVERYVAP